MTKKTKKTKKRGKIKYADPEKGYGYILAEDAVDPTQTVLFEAKDADSAIEELPEGTEVVFEVEGEASQASRVESPKP